MEGTVGVSGSQPSLVGRPEPPVDVLGEEVRPVTPIEVAEAARGPEVGHVGWEYISETRGEQLLPLLTIHESLHPLVLLSSLEGDEVHAPLPAVVTGVEPVPLGVLHTVVVVLPAEPVKVTVEPLDTALVNS